MANNCTRLKKIAAGLTGISVCLIIGSFIMPPTGVQLTTIQKLLGHQKMQTTQIYSEVDRRAIANDIKKSKATK